MATVSTSNVGKTNTHRIAIYAIVALVLQMIFLAIWSLRFYALHDPLAPMVGRDFVVFWSAARVTLEHGAAAVFSAQWMQPVEAALRLDTYAPWPYPPTFLLTVLGLGFMPFGRAFVLFSVIGVLAYGATLAPLMRGLGRPPCLLVAACPGLGVALALGQNSLLTVAAAAAALALLERGSVLAGIGIAALAIKPQLAIFFPLVLICARRWNVIALSAACTIAFAGTSVAVFGRDAWVAFASFLPEFDRLAVENGQALWRGMPTLFAACRLAGTSVATAYAVHALVALPAVAALAYLWHRHARFELRAAALITVTLLAQPYLMYYDLVWLVLPIAFLVRDADTQPPSPLEWAILGAAWLMPAEGLLAMLLDVPVQLAPLVLIALLVVIVRRHLAADTPVPLAVGTAPR